MRYDSNIPLYIQIKEAVKLDIAEGKFPYGSKIPTELELMDIYKVSRITVRKAISELVDSKLLVKQQGKGTFVLRPTIERQVEQTLLSKASKVQGFTELLKQQGYEVSNKLIHCQVKQPTSLQREWLKLDLNHQIIEIKRVRYIDEDPLLLEIVVLSFDHYDFLLECDLHHSLYDVLRNHHIYPENILHFSIESVSTGVQRARFLNTNSHDPLLFQRIVVGDIHNIPINFSEQYFIGNRYKFIFI